MNIRILVVEDDRNTRVGLAALLEMEGHCVDVCDDASSALARLRQQTYDLLLTDHVMPGTSGLELTHAALLMQPEIHCVIMSGIPRPDAVDGSVTWLNKPIEIESLLQECSRILAAPRLDHPPA